MYRLHFHLSVDDHLDSFHLLVIVDNATMNMYVKIKVQVHDFSYLGYIARNEIA